MTDLLRQLIDRLCSTYRAWNVYEQGDFQYFLQIEDSSDDTSTADMRLRTIKKLTPGINRVWARLTRFERRTFRIGMLLPSLDAISL